ncbi:unnamed protein product [Acanthosepion pharaonis]|uniref:Uncharacterized protein n=1 Tax=Acanthosepion pharaonis TaxID=158019 RepID=A0A812CBV8_ACAPH|nr:unnamed protein product [Sepia pharaonis]
MFLIRGDDICRRNVKSLPVAKHSKCLPITETLFINRAKAEAGVYQQLFLSLSPIFFLHFYIIFCLSFFCFSLFILPFSFPYLFCFFFFLFLFPHFVFSLHSFPFTFIFFLSLLPFSSFFNSLILFLSPFLASFTFSSPFLSFFPFSLCFSLVHLFYH